jgi:hypothetical protein
VGGKVSVVAAVPIIQVRELVLHFQLNSVLTRHLWAWPSGKVRVCHRELIVRCATKLYIEYI